MTEIRLSAIEKTYGAQRVLTGVDLAVPDGAVVALLGPSGCGKTTLLRLIAGFERADAGTIVLGGRTVEAPGSFVPPERRRIGYVPQEGALFPHLTVAGNIGFGLRGRDGRAERVAEMLALVGLAGHAGKFPHQLSGGQQQRVALARALAPRPDVILLDEPFNALDLGLRRHMSEEVVGLLRRHGTTSLLVTHDPAEAFATADIVAVMAGGDIIQCAPPVEVYTHPASAEVATLTGAAIFLDATARGGHAETALGAVALSGSRQPEGTRLRLMLRPEQLRLAATGAGREAAVTGSRFKGDHWLVTVTIGGLALDIRAQDPPDGTVAFVTVAGSGTAFPAAGTAAPHAAA